MWERGYVHKSKELRLHFGTMHAVHTVYPNLGGYYYGTVHAMLGRQLLFFINVIVDVHDMRYISG